MAGRIRIRLRDVRALKPSEIIWDSAVPGFGARRQQDSVSYILRYRTADARQRWLTIGRHGAPWTPDTARVEARRVLGEVVKGGDPAADKRATRHALAVAERCDCHITDTEVGPAHRPSPPLAPASPPRQMSNEVLHECGQGHHRGR
jgi:hypothetical protein